MTRDDEAAESLRRAAAVFERAVEALGTREKAARWLASPNRAFDGQVPEALLSTADGATTVLQYWAGSSTGYWANQSASEPTCLGQWECECWPASAGRPPCRLPC
jgi:hypothetical protein